MNAHRPPMTHPEREAAPLLSAAAGRIPDQRLPNPRERLAGCIWLPRILAKARLALRGSLPLEYGERFCHATGVDGQFLAFFGIGRDALEAAAEGDDAEVAAWFTALPRATPERIQEWNRIAVNLGRPGFPMADRLPIAKATAYRDLETDESETVFELL